MSKTFEGLEIRERLEDEGSRDFIEERLGRDLKGTRNGLEKDLKNTRKGLKERPALFEGHFLWHAVHCALVLGSLRIMCVALHLHVTKINLMRSILSKDRLSLAPALGPSVSL